MEEEELIKEAEEALHEIEMNDSQHHRHHKIGKIKIPEEKKHNPFAYLLVLILLLLIIMMAVPYYGIKIDPTPKNIPTRADVIHFSSAVKINDTPSIIEGSKADYNKVIVPSHFAIRNTAVNIATSDCKSSEICYSKALFFFVRDNFEYIGDPPNEYLDSPFETLRAGASDCDGLAILLANLELAIGTPTRLAFIPNHVYVQVKIDDAPNKYKEDDGWISLDPTCKACDFGEVPYSTQNKRKEFLYI